MKINKIMTKTLSVSGKLFVCVGWYFGWQQHFYRLGDWAQLPSQVWESDSISAVSVHNGKVRGQIWTFLKLKLELRWVLRNWGKTEAFRCFFTECKSVEIWLRYKHFSDPPNSKIIAGMLKNLAAHFCHCAVACRRRVIPFSVSPYKLDAIMECLRYRSAKSDAYFSFN